MRTPAGTGAWLRRLATVGLLALVVVTLRGIDDRKFTRLQNERLYFPSGQFLVESSLGFRETMADWLWFRFVQYYGAYKKGQNDLRYLDLLIDSITRLDPRFVEAYHLASLIMWSDFGRTEDSFDILRRAILANPDVAQLPFQIGFMHYVIEADYPRAAHWFEVAGRCADATDRERRFAAFARHRAGDDRVSIALWEELRASTKSPQMQALADKMIAKLRRKLEIRARYGEDFIGPIPEL